jgi:hypothetical protein
MGGKEQGAAVPWVAEAIALEKVTTTPLHRERSSAKEKGSEGPVQGRRECEPVIRQMAQIVHLNSSKYIMKFLGKL